MKAAFFGLIGLLISSPSFALTNSVPAEEQEFIAVVMITLDAKDEDGGVGPGFCNATIVSDRELVTAAHCVAHAFLLNSREARVQIGVYKYVTDKQGIVRRIGYATIAQIQDHDARFLLSDKVENQLRRGGFNTTIQPEDDNARIQLSASIDLKGLKITPMVPASAAELEQMRRSPGQFPLTVVTVNPIAEISTNDTRRKATLDRVSWNRGSIESRSSSQVEPMDSGSPVFTKWNGAWRLVAVVKGHAKAFFREWDVMSILPAR